MLPSDWRRHLSGILTPTLGLGLAFAVVVPAAPSTAWWVLAILGIVLWRHPEGRWVGGERLWLGALVLVPLVALLSLVNASDVIRSAGRIEKFLRFAMAVPVYLAWRGQAESRAAALFKFVVVGAALLGPIALQQVFVGGAERAYGVVGPLRFGDMAMVLAVLLSVWPLPTGELSGPSTASKTGGRLLRRAAVASALVACLFSQTRNAFLVVPVLIVALPILLRRQVRLRRWLPAWVGLAVLVLILDSIFADISSHVVLAVRETIGWWQGVEGGAATSVGGRLYLWEVCVALWKQHPLLGNGVGDYLADTQALLRATGSVLFEENRNLSFHAHSAYLQTLVTQGILGMTTLLVVLLVPIWQGCLLLRTATDQRDVRAALACVAPALCFLVFGIGDTWVVKNSFVSMYLLLQVPFMALASARLRAASDAV
jgi:O-antigen ligase